MNYSIIIYIIGWILKLEAAFMLLPGHYSNYLQRKNRLCFPYHYGNLSGSGHSSYQEKAETKSLLHKRGLRDCCPELDCTQYYGRSSLCAAAAQSPIPLTRFLKQFPVSQQQEPVF